MSSSFTICRDGDPVPAALRGAVAAIGNFDGVHRGHQHLLAMAREEGARQGRPKAAITFEPHPRDFFNPHAPLFRLTPEAVKLEILRRLGLDGVFLQRFDGALATLSAEDFVGELLARRWGVSHVVVGPDFHFGRNREGTPARLEELCRGRGIGCTIVPVVAEQGRTVSSTAIRAALERGEVGAANALLDYRWFVRGEVRHGEKRGRTLGYPTANMQLGADCRLRHGIYAVRARVGEAVHGGVASYGRRPTFDNGAPLLESFLFDFSGDLYGRVLDVEFVARIRGEERFASAEALVERMNLDAEEARGHLARDRTRSMIG
jgi:riboflavin kinase/FMN adenylyltransferase